MENNLY